MSTALRNALSAAAEQFVSNILGVLGKASIHDFVALTSGTASAAAPRVPREPSEKKVDGRTKAGGPRLRRTAADIENLTEQIVEVVNAAGADGIGAEEIRKSLGIETKILQRPLMEAFKNKRFSKKGSKRSTKYFGNHLKANGVEAEPEIDISAAMADVSEEVAPAASLS